MTETFTVTAVGIGTLDSKKVPQVMKPLTNRVEVYWSWPPRWGWGGGARDDLVMFVLNLRVFLEDEIPKMSPGSRKINPGLDTIRILWSFEDFPFPPATEIQTRPPLVWSGRWRRGARCIFLEIRSMAHRRCYLSSLFHRLHWMGRPMGMLGIVSKYTFVL